MSNFFSQALATIGAGLIHAAGNAPAGSIAAIALQDLEPGTELHADFEAAEPVVVGSFTEHGLEGKVIVVQTSSPAYLTLFPVARASAEIAAAAKLDTAA